jgi:hypothetical protein
MIRSIETKGGEEDCKRNQMEARANQAKVFILQEIWKIEKSNLGTDRKRIPNLPFQK